MSLFKKIFNNELRFWIIGIGGFLLLRVFIEAFSAFSGDPAPILQPPTAQPSAVISSPKAQLKASDKDAEQRVSALCESLPKPEKIYLTEKSVISSSSDFALVRYTYKSTRSWDEILPGFVVWLNANGWQALEINKTTFTKGGQTIAFAAGTAREDAGKFYILCSEKDASAPPVTFSGRDL
jgi:hypothetical protein